MTCRKLLLTACVALSIAVSPAFAQSRMVGGAQMFENRTIVENASVSLAHTSLMAAVKADGLVETLSGPGPFTLFAPTNDAFAKLPPGTLETLLKPENKDKLTRILTCHMVAANALSSAIAERIGADKGSYPMKTVGGCILQARLADGRITLTDENGGVATVKIADVRQSNGVIHVIDTVLMPKSPPKK